MKRWLEEISVQMGYGGEINDAVMAEGQRQMEGTDDGRSSNQTSNRTESATRQQTVGEPLRGSIRYQ